MCKNAYEKAFNIPADCFEKKPLLKKIYKAFYELIAEYVSKADNDLAVVELGAGAGNIKEVIPRCIQTGLFFQPWLDSIENAYQLSFASATVSDLILFDVFHHLQYPGTALKEFHRVLSDSGRVIIFEPCVSLLGIVVYGLFHHEPLSLGKSIQWVPPVNWSPDDMTYYAAQGNAWKVFCRNRRAWRRGFNGWKIIECKRLAAVSYVASGGYSRPQLYPETILPLMRRIDILCQLFPAVFATRLLVVLEKQP